MTVQPRRVQVVWVVVGALLAFAAGGAFSLAIRQPADTATSPSTPPPTQRSTELPPSPEILAARDLRRRASDALAAGNPGDCLRLLDEARAKDPEGDGAPQAKSMRARARMLLAPPAPPSAPPAPK
jgi:hypothetical protein